MRRTRREGSPAPVVVVGDTLFDRDLDGATHRLAPDAPVPVIDQPYERSRPGGAGLAAMLAARDGRPVTLVTALGADDAGQQVAGLLAAAGVAVRDLGLRGSTPQKVRIHAGGRPLARLDYGDDATVGEPGERARAAIAGASAVLVSDYGRGVAALPSIRAALDDAIAAGAEVVWDPHPNGATPVHGARVVTPNVGEARGVGNGEDEAEGEAEGDSGRRREHGRRHGGDGWREDLRSVTSLAVQLRDHWHSAGVAITLGDRGALLVGGDGTPLMVPTSAATVGDPCGAGDRFAAAVAGALADGAVLSEAVVDGVRAASMFVANGGARGLITAAAEQSATAEEQAACGCARTHIRPQPHPGAASDGGSNSGATSDDHDTVVARLVAEVHARGGTIVATGGCFDLLHAGHVRLLTDARQLGDRLVVCINSDASVRRLKGAGRPVVSAEDRRAVLLGLAAVDAVVVFDDDTPERVLSGFRPDVWVKGADYAVADLPEAALLSQWGGQAVVLPYLAGRSTTSMIERGIRHG